MTAPTRARNRTLKTRVLLTGCQSGGNVKEASACHGPLPGRKSHEVGNSSQHHQGAARAGGKNEKGREESIMAQEKFHRGYSLARGMSGQRTGTHIMWPCQNGKERTQESEVQKKGAGRALAAQIQKEQNDEATVRSPTCHALSC